MKKPREWNSTMYKSLLNIRHNKRVTLHGWYYNIYVYIHNSIKIWIRKVVKTESFYQFIFKNY